MKHFTSLVAVVLAVVLLSGCKKEDSTTNTSNGYTPPNLSVAQTTITLPTALTSQTNSQAATVAAGYVSMANTMSLYLSYLSQIPAGADESALKSTGKRYTWTDAPSKNTVWLETSDDDMNYYWKYYLNGK